MLKLNSSALSVLLSSFRYLIITLFCSCFIFSSSSAEWNSSKPAPQGAAVYKHSPSTVKPRPVKSTKRKVKRTRKEMILEVEMKAIKEALTIKKDEERTSRFVSKAEAEHQKAQKSATNSQTMLNKANETVETLKTSQQTAITIIDKVKTMSEEVRLLSAAAKKEANMAGIDITTFTKLRQESLLAVKSSETREANAINVLKRAKQKEQYYRALEKRRIRNAEDFFYIADAAMKKGGNAQAMEFAIKAKAEMQQAKIAETEANIRAEAVLAAEKVVAARKEATLSARLKARSFASLLKLAKEISISLTEASEAARLGANAVNRALAKVRSFSKVKEKVLTSSNKKIASLSDVKASNDKQVVLTDQAVQAAKAVLVAKQKAQAHAQERARFALSEAKSLVIVPAEAPPQTEIAPTVK